MADYAKIEISGKLLVKTGLHIGGSTAFAAIGATDSPVIVDTFSGRPIIPGSSIKGKMRTLLSKVLNENPKANHSDDDEKIRRLFGDTKSPSLPSRLLFQDLIMTEDEAQNLRNRGARTLTEVKFENTINRKTAVANPRQIERVIAGSQFDFLVIYDVLNTEEIQEDLENLRLGIKLLEFDYLGGSGSRGYGRVEFKSLQAKVVLGKNNDTLLKLLESFNES
ncbi:MAG: type III-A CRISPR-associated RAMP protein Csm3 [Candidatus Ancillula sp.]|jgi:CRISPR-associated protein Csm3|nr:type III-A CRISPR-associated RAMP protein Csm3 [Candidatus Ancillula sp.]